MDGHTFVCYARTDSDFVLKLVSTLKSRGASVWLDRHDIKGGADWNASIDDAIDRCVCFLMVLSPDAKRREVEGELHRALNKDKPIVPLLYRPCEIPRQLLTTQCIECGARKPDDPALINEVLTAMGFKAWSTSAFSLAPAALEPVPDLSARESPLLDWTSQSPADGFLLKRPRLGRLDAKPRFDIRANPFDFTMPSTAEPSAPKKSLDELKRELEEYAERRRKDDAENEHFRTLRRGIAADECVVCPWCGEHVETRRLADHRSQRHFEKSWSEVQIFRKVSGGPTAEEHARGKADCKGDQESLTRCPACTNEVKRKNLFKHWNKHW